MSIDEQFENLRNIAKKLRENMNITELSLLSFNDGLRKILFTGMTRKNIVDAKDIKDIPELLNLLVNIQAEYTKVKTSIEMILTMSHL